MICLKIFAWARTIWPKQTVGCEASQLTYRRNVGKKTPISSEARMEDEWSNSGERATFSTLPSNLNKQWLINSHAKKMVDWIFTSGYMWAITQAICKLCHCHSITTTFDIELCWSCRGPADFNKAFTINGPLQAQIFEGCLFNVLFCLVYTFTVCLGRVFWYHQILWQWTRKSKWETRRLFPHLFSAQRTYFYDDVHCVQLRNFN